VVLLKNLIGEMTEGNVYEVRGYSPACISVEFFVLVVFTSLTL